MRVPGDDVVGRGLERKIEQPAIVGMGDGRPIPACGLLGSLLKRDCVISRAALSCEKLGPATIAGRADQPTHPNLLARLLVCGEREENDGRGELPGLPDYGRPALRTSALQP